MDLVCFKKTYSLPLAMETIAHGNEDEASSGDFRILKLPS
jgi:hypothetical protein